MPTIHVLVPNTVDLQAIGSRESQTVAKGREPETGGAVWFEHKPSPCAVVGTLLD
jgi:hypothetical protein